MSNMYLSPNEVSGLSKDLTKYGVFPVESLFTPAEWFKLLSIQPIHRSTAVCLKLKNHPQYTASVARSAIHGEVYKVLVAEKANPEKVVGCISIPNLLSYTRSRAPQIQEDAEQIQQIKQKREEYINELKQIDTPTDTPPEPEISETQDAPATPEAAPATINRLQRIRMQNALSLFPVAFDDPEDLADKCRAYYRVYKEFGATISRIMKSEPGKRNYAALAPFLQEPNELVVVTQFAMSKDPALYEDFKAHSAEWSGGNPSAAMMLCAIYMDPNTDPTKLGDHLKDVDFNYTSGRKFFSHPNALLYIVDAFTRRAADKEITDGDKAFFKNYNKFYSPDQRNFGAIVSSVLSSPFKNNFSEYYTTLVERDIVDPNFTGIAKRVRDNISNFGAKWLPMELASLRKSLCEPAKSKTLEELEISI